MIFEGSKNFAVGDRDRLPRAIRHVNKIVGMSRTIHTADEHLHTMMEGARAYYRVRYRVGHVDNVTYISRRRQIAKE